MRKEARASRITIVNGYQPRAPESYGDKFQPFNQYVTVVCKDFAQPTINKVMDHSA